MKIDLFGTRKRLASQTETDVYVYDDIPYELRVQISHICLACIGAPGSARDIGAVAWKLIREVLLKEHARITLYNQYAALENYHEDVVNYFLKLKCHEKALEVIEICARVIDTSVTKHLSSYMDSRIAVPGIILQDPVEGIEEINFRLRRASIGYRYQDGLVVRVDSELSHEHIVKPALNYLGSDKRLQIARSEFLSAHEHYRKGENKDALVDALCAYESVMKVVLDSHGVSVPAKSNCSDLVKILFDNNVVPTYLQTQLSGLRSMLETSVATIRNKLGGHGQGAVAQDVPDEYVSYVISTASAAISLIGSHIK